MKNVYSGLIKLTATSILMMSLVACGGADERKVKYLEKGKAYLADKNYEKAKIEFKNVLQIDPKYAEAYFLMGQLNEADKDLGKALGNYRKAIDLNPEYTEAKVKLARIYVIAGTPDFIDKATQLLSEVAKEDAAHSEAALISATIKYKKGDKKVGVLELESIVRKDPSLVQGVSLLSTIYIVDGNEAKAVNLLTKAVNNNKKNIPLRISLAKILAKNKKNADAEKYLKQVIDIEPEKFSSHVALSSFYAASNQVDKAETVLRNAIALDKEDAIRYLVLVEMLASKVSVKAGEDVLIKAINNNPEMYELKFAQVKFYQKISQFEKAKSILMKIIDDKSYDIEGVNARNELARYLFSEGDYQGSKKYIDEVLAEYPNNNNALLLAGQLALINSDAVGAINGLRTVVKNEPKNAEASMLLAQAHEMNKESSLAENELKKAIEANPVNDQTHVNYAKYLLSKGRIGEALNVVDKALVYFEDSYQLMDLKLRIVGTQGKESEIIALLNMMESSHSDEAEVNIIRGQYYLSKHNIESAIEEFEKAYAKSRDKYKSLQLIVRAYVSNKQSEKAVARLQKNLEVNENDSVANLLLGDLYISQNKLPEARDVILKSISSADSWFLPYKSLAITYLMDKDFDKALSVYQDAAKKIKNKSIAQLQVASIYERQKKYTQAMGVYEKILADNASNIIATNNYASLLLDYGEDSDAPKALELAKSFKRLYKPALQDTLGWAYAKTGDNTKAIEVLKPVVEKAPEVAIFRYHLGYALYHSGDKAAAKSHLEIAVSSPQEYTGKDKAIELLKSI